jgi:hypothetical protein
MKYNETKYYFSFLSLTFATIVLSGMTLLALSASMMLYQESLLFSILFALPLVIILVALPDYLRFMYCLLTGKPALVLTDEFLINNAKGQTYKWSEIEEISYKKFKGYRPPPGGYIEITFKGSEKKISLPNNAIKCKTKELLMDLKEYLRSR